MATKDIVLIALFAALVAALGVVPNITLPMAGGVPITAQSMGVMLAGALLGVPRQQERHIGAPGPVRHQVALLVLVQGR